MKKVFCSNCKYYPRPFFFKWFKWKPVFQECAKCQNPDVQILYKIQKKKFFDMRELSTFCDLKKYEDAPKVFSEFCSNINMNNMCRFFEKDE